MKILISVIIIILLTTSCKNDFDVDLPWKDISIIYCVLNPEDSVHYVKLNKSFLGGGDITSYAQISDSIYYSDAVVKLIKGILNSENEFIEDENNSVLMLEKTNTIPKDSGIFSSNNIIYKTVGSNSILDQTKDYKLLIEIPDKENIEAYTSIIPINTLTLNKPDKIDLSISDTLEYEWRSVKNAGFYQSKIQFVYTEIFNNVATTKTIILKQESQSSRFDFGGETMQMTLTGKVFLEYIRAVIMNSPDYNPDADRVANAYVPLPNDPLNPRNRYPFKLILNICSSDLEEYVQFSQAAGSIQTEMPYYSNIPDCVGIYACRANKIIVKQPTDKTINDLSKSYITKELNFMDIYQTASYWSHNEN